MRGYFRHKNNEIMKLESLHQRMVNRIPINILDMNTGDFLDKYENNYDEIFFP